jgi:hypothetical protein
MDLRLQRVLRACFGHWFGTCRIRRWRQYVRAVFTAVRLGRAKEDECDACIRLKMQPEDNSLDSEARAAIEEELALHMNAATEQRRIMPARPTGAYIIGDSRRGVRDENDTPAVMVKAEDFGGGVTMPHYGFRPPSPDYYSSNPIIQNFVIANINDHVNNVWLRDERAQDKDENCMCSLGMRYHLRHLDRYKLCSKRPTVSTHFSISKLHPLLLELEIRLF